MNGDPSFPAQAAVRVAAPGVHAVEVPDGMVGLDGGWHELVVRYRVRETGQYGQAPFIDEWKPLPPRLHQAATLRRSVQLGRFTISVHEVTNVEYAVFVRATG